MFIGCDGSCIGIANIAPEYWAEFTTQCLDQKFNEARETFMMRLLPLMQHCWAENQPRATTHSASTKEALRLLGVFSSSRVRPPEQDVDEHESAEIRVGLEKAGLLPPQRLRATA
jgi:dihydrodipicolinate synthase/N-acetylneuraminate lyase